MYRSVRHAVSAMLRYQERHRAAAPVRLNGSRGRTPGEDPDADALTVLVLFHRYNRRRYLKRNLIDRVPLDEFRGRDRTEAARYKSKFIRELCHRGLLEYQGEDRYPQKECQGYARPGICRFCPDE